MKQPALRIFTDWVSILRVCLLNVLCDWVLLCREAPSQLLGLRGNQLLLSHRTIFIGQMTYNYVIQFGVTGRLPPKSGTEQICYFSDTSSMLQVNIRNLENVFCHGKYENFLTFWSSQMWSVVIVINVIFLNVLYNERYQYFEDFTWLSTPTLHKWPMYDVIQNYIRTKRPIQSTKQTDFNFTQYDLYEQSSSIWFQNLGTGANNIRNYLKRLYKNVFSNYISVWGQTLHQVQPE